MGNIIHKRDIEGMGKNTVVLWSEPHDDNNLFALQVNNDLVAFITIEHDGKIDVKPAASKKIKLKNWKK